MVGIVSLDDFDDRGFRCAVGITDEIVVAFLLDFEFFELGDVPDEYGAATASCHYGYIL